MNTLTYKHLAFDEEIVSLNEVEDYLKNTINICLYLEEVKKLREFLYQN